MKRCLKVLLLKPGKDATWQSFWGTLELPEVVQNRTCLHPLVLLLLEQVLQPWGLQSKVLAAGSQLPALHIQWGGYFGPAVVCSWRLSTQWLLMCITYASQFAFIPFHHILNALMYRTEIMICISRGVLVEKQWFWCLEPDLSIKVLSVPALLDFLWLECGSVGVLEASWYLSLLLGFLFWWLILSAERALLQFPQLKYVFSWVYQLGAIQKILVKHPCYEEHYVMYLLNFEWGCCWDEGRVAEEGDYNLAAKLNLSSPYLDLSKALDTVAHKKLFKMKTSRKPARCGRNMLIRRWTGKGEQILVEEMATTEVPGGCSGSALIASDSCSWWKEIESEMYCCSGEWFRGGGLL